MLHRHIVLSTRASLQRCWAGVCPLQPSPRLPAEPLLHVPFGLSLFMYFLKWKPAGLLFDCDCHLLFHVEKQLLRLLMLWCVSYSVTKKKKAWKIKTRLHLHGPPQVHPGGYPCPLLQYHSHCLTQQRTNGPHPLILLRATPPQKHKPAIYYQNFSADSKHIPASHQSSGVAQPSQPLLPSLEGQKLGCAGGNRNHYCWSNRFRGPPQLRSCSHSMSQEHAIVLLCVWRARQTRREFRTNVKKEKNITWWLHDVIKLQ